MKAKDFIKTIECDELFLRQKSKVVDFNDLSYLEDIKLLKQYCMESATVFAMASIQLGIPKRIIYLKNTTLDIPPDDSNYNENQVLINPIIITKKGHTRFWEACASCLDNTGLVDRPYEIEMQYQDELEQVHVKKFVGFEATVLSHEFDHLDGILHIDIASEIIKMTKEERKVFRELHPYEILSKDCDFFKEVSNKTKTL